MKRTAAAILLTLALCAAAGAQSPASGPRPPRARKASAESVGKTADAVDEVEQVFDRYFLASGGVASFMVKTRIMRGNVETLNTGASLGFESYEKLPKKSLIVISGPGGQFIQASDAGKKWVNSPWGGVTAAPKSGGDDILNRPDKTGGFKWRSLFSSVRVKGRAQVGGRPATVLAATPLGSEPSLMYFDAENGMLVKIEYGPAAGGKKGDLKALHIDSYATVDGIKVPAAFRHEFDDMTMTFRVYEIKHDVKIDDALFAAPKGK
ncbi:MAG: hypothetical protein LC795_21680 [Acidobacteria bacterium]|nr:hypothetical protein [Acidobacteriota bacterium]